MLLWLFEVQIREFLTFTSYMHLFHYYYYSFSCNNIKNLNPKFFVSDDVFQQRLLFISIILLFCFDTPRTLKIVRTVSHELDMKTKYVKNRLNVGTSYKVTGSYKKLCIYYQTNLSTGGTQFTFNWSASEQPYSELSICPSKVEVLFSIPHF